MYNENGYNIDHLSRCYDYEDLLNMMIKSSVAEQELRSMLKCMRRTNGTMYSYAAKLADALKGYADAVKEAKQVRLERELDKVLPLR